MRRFPGAGGTRQPLPAAAHLHAWDTRGAVFAIDAWETLRKGGESLGLTPLRETERLVVGGEKRPGRERKAPALR